MKDNHLCHTLKLQINKSITRETSSTIFNKLKPQILNTVWFPIATICNTKSLEILFGNQLNGQMHIYQPNKQISSLLMQRRSNIFTNKGNTITDKHEVFPPIYTKP